MKRRYAQRLRVDGEEAHRGAVFGRHVGDRGAVGQAQARKPRAVELDEFADHAFLAQHFGDDQHQVGRRRAFRQAAVQLEADDFRNQHRERLAEHGGLCFDPADAPAEHAEAVDHRRVRVGADQRIGERVRLAVNGGVKHDAREIFEVHLMADAGVGRHDLEIVERTSAPQRRNA